MIGIGCEHPVREHTCECDRRRRQEATGAARPERAQRDTARAALLSQQQRGDQEARQGEERADPEEAAAGRPELGVEQDDRRNGDAPEPVEGAHACRCVAAGLHCPHPQVVTRSARGGMHEFRAVRRRLQRASTGTSVRWRAPDTGRGEGAAPRRVRRRSPRPVSRPVWRPRRPWPTPAGGPGSGRGSRPGRHRGRGESHRRARRRLARPSAGSARRPVPASCHRGA